MDAPPPTGTEDNSAAVARPGPRPRAGGWGFDAPASSSEPGPTPDPAPAPQGNRHFEADNNDDVPIIPDLEEEAEEDITRQVAAPPTVGQNFAAPPVRSVRELEGALQSRAAQLPASPEEGVDLAPLMRCLCTERQVFETDTTWDHELIFQEVASDINAELTAEEGGGEDAVDQNNFQNNAMMA